MNFVYVVVVSAIIAVGTAVPMDKAAVRAAAKEMVLACKTQVGASDADVESVKMHKMPSTQEGLCMLECVFDKTSIMQGGKFSKTGMIEAFKPLLAGDATKTANLQKLAGTCEKEVGNGDSDKCKTAKMLVECIVKNGESHGFEMPPPAA